MSLKKIFITILMLLGVLLLTNINVVKAVENTDTGDESIDYKDISMDIILEIYDQITQEYSSDELADMILQNKEKIMEEEGLSEDVIDAGAEFIRNTDKKEIRNIIENDPSINAIIENIQNGQAPEDAIVNAIGETSSTQKLGLVAKIFLANSTVKMVVWIIVILFVYCTITRWIIYHKAGKKGFAAIIPFYRQITMYRVCGLSPFLMLLWLVPVFGWIAMFIIAIMKRILLAQSFGRSGFFGIGILILPPIFYSILAFNKNIEYEGREE